MKGFYCLVFNYFTSHCPFEHANSPLKFVLSSNSITPLKLTFVKDFNNSSYFSLVISSNGA